MTGIIPTPAAGGVVVRDSSGACQTPAGVQNSYCPDPEFTSTCTINYLPNDCSARITAAQINAIQAEMIALAERFNPDGGWNCGSVENLAGNFNAWQAGTGQPDTLWRRTQLHLCGLGAITDAELDVLPNATVIMCDGNGDLRRYAIPDWFADADDVAAAICASSTATDTLKGCINENTVIASDNGVLTVTGATDAAGKTTYTLGYDVDSAMAEICANPTALASLQGCLAPYPVIAAGDDATVVSTTAPDGTITYTITANAVGSVTYDVNTGDLSVVNTDGTFNTVNIPAGGGGGGSFTGTSPAGNTIATYDDGLGNTTDINESVTTFTRDPVTGELVYVDEAGVETRIASDDTDIEANSLTWDVATEEFVSVVTEDGVPFESRLQPISSLVDCGNRLLGIRPDGGLGHFRSPMPYLQNPDDNLPDFISARNGAADGAIDLDNMPAHPNWDPVNNHIAWPSTYNIDVTAYAGGCAAYLNGFAEVLISSASAIDQLEFGTVDAEITTQFGIPGGASSFTTRVGGDNFGGAGSANGSTMDGRNSSALVIKVPLAAGAGLLSTLIRIPEHAATTGSIETWDATISARVLGVHPAY